MFSKTEINKFWKMKLIYWILLEIDVFIRWYSIQFKLARTKTVSWTLHQKSTIQLSTHIGFPPWTTVEHETIRQTLSRKSQSEMSCYNITLDLCLLFLLLISCMNDDRPSLACIGTQEREANAWPSWNDDRPSLACIGTQERG
jgi:hypothetical protein